MSGLGKSVVLLIILSIGLMIFIKSLDYYSPDFSKGYLLDKEEAFKGIFRIGLYAHIITAPFILLFGSVQAFFRYEARFGRWHSLLGKCYCMLILFVSAPGALIMSFYAFGAWPSKLNFLLLSMLWFVYTWWGYKNGRSKDFVSHKHYMICSYILTLSAVMLRVWSFIFIQYLHFHGPFAYLVMSVLSWVPFLLMAEVWLRTQRIEQRKVTSAVE